MSRRTSMLPDLDDLNDYNRNLYRDEVAGLIERFNGSLKPGEPKLYAPHIKFNREIGQLGRTEVPCADRANRSTTAPTTEHLKDYMPSAEDKKLLLEIIGTEKKWIAEKSGARDPLASIGEVRKSAINL